MTTRHIIGMAALAMFALAALPGAALAATAHAGDRISIFSGPNNFDPVLGMLQAGEEVTIDRCSASGRWCRVFSNQPTGWVPADELVGAAAKAEATPLRSLTDPLFDDQKDLDRTRHDFW